MTDIVCTDSGIGGQARIPTEICRHDIALNNITMIY